MRSSSALRRASVAAFVCMGAWTGACIGFSDSGGPECTRDTDCAGECTNTGICVPAGASLSVRIFWTVAGEAPTPLEPGPCEGVAELEVRFLAGDQVGTSYRPVTCSLGQITFDKLPPDFDRVTVSAFSSSGAVLDSVSADLNPAGETLLEIDLEL